MEMRKFIIELHGDGSMSWVEYEDQKENQNAAVEDWLILQLIKHTIRHG